MKYHDGTFYGMIYNTYPQGRGGIFKYDCINNLLENKIYLYDSNDGSNPSGKLLQAIDGLVYGIIKNGGSNGFYTDTILS